MTVRIIALVEGQTEETFVRQLLAPDFGARGVALTATTYGRPRTHGGVPSWGSAQRELLRLLKEDRSRYVTTMFDYYGLPRDWPGREDVAGRLLASDRADVVERAMLRQIMDTWGADRNEGRFIPYIQMHEFEALLFSEPKILGRALSPKADLDRTTSTLRQVTDSFATPEEIDDGATTAPSKRILSLAQEYQKVVDGNRAAVRIGLAKMRQACPHFGDWLARLEALQPRIASPAEDRRIRAEPG